MFDIGVSTSFRLPPSIIFEHDTEIRQVASLRDSEKTIYGRALTKNILTDTVIAASEIADYYQR
jgi:hypothetical protein